MNRCPAYFTRISSDCMNSFENYLVSNDIDYSMLSTDMSNSKVTNLYLINVQDTELLALKLIFSIKTFLSKDFS
jgi:hypothetical protein